MATQQNKKRSSVTRKLPKHYVAINSCRICGSQKLTDVVYFKPQFIASTFVKTNKNNPKSKIKISMTLLLCRQCGLVQLRETVEPNLLYEQYFYRSNVSNTMNRDLRDVVADVMSRVPMTLKDSVLDIGCNDGLMLTFYPDTVKRVGIDPAKNIDWTPLPRSIEIVNDYFPSEKLAGRKFNIITSTAMFYDLNDPNKAVRDIKKLLANGGVLCIQVSYLYDTIRDMNFYDVCHEHLEYYSLKTISYLMQRNGMEVFDASTNAVNGGSLRVLIGHKGVHHKNKRNLAYLSLREEAMRLEEPQTYDIFSKLVTLNTKRVHDYIKKQKGLVIGLGASTKGNVLLQLCQVTKKMLPYISERNPMKVGLHTLGTDILLISEDQARKKNPDCMFVIPWNFKAEIVEREKMYLQHGGTLLFIMPYPYVLDKHGETKL